MIKLNTINKKLICHFCDHCKDIGICDISKNVVNAIDGFGCRDFDRTKGKINIKGIEKDEI